MAFFAANRVKVSTATTGTSNFVVGAATSSAFRNFASASVPDGATVHYTASTSTEFECGEGVYTAGTTTLSRDTIFASSNSDNLVNFGSAPTIAITPLAETLATSVNFNVKDYGATGDGVTDDTEAIQDAVQAMRDAMDEEPYGFGFNLLPAYLYFPPGRYYVTDSINLQNMKGTVPSTVGWGIIGYGATVDAATSGKTLFDCLGSSNAYVRGLQVLGNPGNPTPGTTPAYAFQLGNLTTAFTTTGDWAFQDVFIHGWFTHAPIYHGNCEGCLYLKCFFSNSMHPDTSPAGERYAFIMDSCHHFETVTEFDPVTIPADTTDSCGGNRFYGCSFFRVIGDAETAAIVIANADAWRFQDCYVLTGIGAAMRIIAVGDAFLDEPAFRGCSLNVHCEQTVDLKTNFEVISPDSPDIDVVFTNLTMGVDYGSGSESIITAGDGIASLTLSGHIDLRRHLAGDVTSGPVFILDKPLPSYTVATLPTTASAGQLVYTSTGSGGVSFYNGSAWVAL
jgi:hypothetical protein